ncbi:MAG: YfhO family protein [Verrucomicrobia bacterium]|nr:YfhO family protein [Verrucomicrobiota bacterium]
MNRLTKYFLIALAAVLGISLLWMVILAVSVDSRTQFFANGGYDMFVPPNPVTGEKASQTMAAQPSQAMFHFFVVAMLAGAMMVNLLWLNGAAKPLLRWGCCGGLALILYVEQWQASSHFMDYRSPVQDYADNAVFQRLRADTGRPRVAFLTRASFYNNWLSLLLPYYDIDSIDIPAASRPPADYTAFFGAVDRDPLRKWELCSVKYILGPKEAAQQSFKQLGADKFINVVMEFDYFGKQALFECTRALPRALVLHRWEIVTDNEKLLARLTDPKFDPHTTLLLDADPGITADASAPSSTAVELVQFRPMRVSLKTSLKTPGILMLNDRFDNGWSATVDDAPAKILRANYIMRAVALPAGDHRVVFSFSAPAGSVWLTQAIWIAITLGLVVTGLRALWRRK